MCISSKHTNYHVQLDRRRDVHLRPTRAPRRQSPGSTVGTVGSVAVWPPPGHPKISERRQVQRVTHNFGDKGVRESGMLIRSEYCVVRRSLDMRSRLRPEMSESVLSDSAVEDHCGRPFIARGCTPRRRMSDLRGVERESHRQSAPVTRRGRRLGRHAPSPRRLRYQLSNWSSSILSDVNCHWFRSSGAPAARAGGDAASAHLAGTPQRSMAAA